MRKKTFFLIFILLFITTASVQASSSSMQPYRFNQGQGKPASQEESLPAELVQLIQNTEKSVLNTNPLSTSYTSRQLEIPQWRFLTAGRWAVYYPPDWIVQNYADNGFRLYDSRGVSSYTQVLSARLQQALSHDQLAEYAMGDITGGNIPLQSLYSFEDYWASNLYQTTPPNGVRKHYFLRWEHPNAGRMFTYLRVMHMGTVSMAEIGYFSTYANWSILSAPEEEFYATWKNTFSVLDQTFYVPPERGGGEDSDGDGVPDHRDSDPLNPYVY